MRCTVSVCAGGLECADTAGTGMHHRLMVVHEHMACVRSVGLACMGTRVDLVTTVRRGVIDRRSRPEVPIGLAGRPTRRTVVRALAQTRGRSTDHGTVSMQEEARRLLPYPHTKTPFFKKSNILILITYI